MLGFSVCTGPLTRVSLRPVLFRILSICGEREVVERAMR
jgi:hypothetical protein